MKKNLTKNITRYDQKMMLRFDKKTMFALLKSVAVGGAIAFALYFVIGMIFAMFTGSIIAIVGLVLQVAAIDGVTMLDYIKSTIKSMIDPSIKKKPYQMVDDEPYRICVSLSSKKKKGESNEKESNMGNNG